MQQTKDNSIEKYPELRIMDGISTIMDNAIPIPFTQKRFGLDALLGLVPNAGDILSLGISGLLILTILRHGVSFTVLLKMIGNIVLDAAVGSIPILGDIFDFSFKANRRNVALLKSHYEEGGKRMNAWLAAGILFVIVIAVAVIMIIFVFKAMGVLWSFIAQQF
jgi:hypothetical protein